jgi:anthranilate synthase component 1
LPDTSSPTLSPLQETASGFRYLTLDNERDLFSIQHSNPLRYPFLLESTAHGPNGRYDILFACPGDTLQLASDGTLAKNGAILDQRFLEALSDEFDSQQRTRDDTLPIPFVGGWFVYLSYELVAETEPTLKKGISASPSPQPVAMAVRVPMAVVVDHALRTTTLVAEDSIDYKQVRAVLDDISVPLPAATDKKIGVRRLQEEDATIYLQAIERTKSYIREGDIFQANLSRLWQAELDGDISSFDIYAALRKTNPSPFSGLVLLDGNQSIISSSPERLVSVSDGIISTRPIAGTHPRGDTPDDDREQSRALLAHPKERAEHIMLIDLERNDLGRVSRPGTVKVNELMTLESYQHVHHIVSEVSGELEEGRNPVDVIRAVFPGGTITGCPKVRCMEIIQELEQGPRGAYTGSMGYINRDGSMDLNILIRTLVQCGNTLSFRAGGGIVADSEPQRELEETRAKARGMLRAIDKD